MSDLQIDVHPLTPDRWTEFESLFAAMGTHAGCWCMWWRLANKAWDAGEGNKTRMHALVHSGVETGLLGYVGGQAVGWVSLAPRTAYVRFAKATADTYRSPDNRPVWSVVCFFVHPDFRRQGVASQLLTAAIAYAAEHGATLLEAYPNDLAVGRPPAASNLNMGTLPLFTQAGFAEVARNHPAKPIVRLELPGSEKA